MHSLLHCALVNPDTEQYGSMRVHDGPLAPLGTSSLAGWHFMAQQQGKLNNNWHRLCLLSLVKSPLKRIVCHTEYYFLYFHRFAEYESQFPSF